MQSLNQSDVSCLGELGLFINQSKDVHGLLSNHVQCGLIVYEGNLLPVDPLLGVLLLLHLEDVLHKELLQVLVGVVDTELLETVVLKVFKAKNIQNSNGTFVSTYL